jgi:hypothetical protein
MIRILAALGAMMVAAACSMFGVKPGASEAEARRAYGTPALEFPGPDGSRQLVFTTGPLGTQTFMVYVSRDGTVQRVDQALTDEIFYRIQTGTTTGADVRRLIGPPHRVVRFDNLRQDAWDYRYRDSWGYLANFSVMVDDRGVVAGKVTVRIESGRDAAVNR